jgi:hypothetical protein
METVAALSSLVPLVGSAVSQVLSGLATDQRLARVDEVLRFLSARVNETSIFSKEYLETEEFRDLLEQTLRQAYHEHHGEKRRLYGRLLLELVTAAREPYDERRRFLRTLDDIQVGQIPLLKSILEHESLPRATGLKAYAAEADRQQAEIRENRTAIEHLDSMGLVHFGGGTWVGKARMPSYPNLTAYGKRFVLFLIKTD